MSLFHTVSGDGPQRLVFLHGLFGQGKNFGQIARNISDLATVYLVDLPDHGRSEWTSEISYRNYVDLVCEKLVELGADKDPINLVGHSLGGRVAMLVALERPELISRLGVLDMSPGERLDSKLYQSYASAMLSIDLCAISNRQEANEALASAVPEEMVRNFLLQNLHRDKESESGWRWLPNVELLRAQMPNFDDWPDISSKRFLGPSEFIAAGQSNYITRRDLPNIYRLFPAVGIEVVMQAGHWVHAEAPDRVTTAMRRLLKRRLWR